MVLFRIQNTDTISAIRDVARLSISEGFPVNLADYIQGVVDVNPESHRRCKVVRSATDSVTGSLTIFTTPQDRDFFLNSLVLSCQNNVVANSTITEIKAFVDGVERSLLAHVKITLTVHDASTSISFPHPIKIDRGTVITVTNTFTVGVATKYASLTGYEVAA